MYHISKISSTGLWRADTVRFNCRLFSILNRSCHKRYGDSVKTVMPGVRNLNLYINEGVVTSKRSCHVITGRSIFDTNGSQCIKQLITRPGDTRSSESSSFSINSTPIRPCHTGREQAVPSTSSDAEEAFMEKARVSALYTGKDQASETGDAGGLVRVDVNLEQRLSDIEKLARNIQERHMQLDVYDLHKAYNVLKKVRAEMSDLESKKKAVASRMAAIVRTKKTETRTQKTPEMESLKAQLIVEGKVIRTQMKENASRVNAQEEVVMLAALQLPADIHPSTPREETVIKMFGSRPDLDEAAKPHMQLAQESNQLILTGQRSGGYYLMGQLAQAQTDIENRAKQMLEEHGFIECECPDMVRKLVQEGCGKPIADPTKVFMIHTHGCDVERELHDNPAMQMYLTGTSPQSFMAYMCGMEVNKKCLPLRLYSTGNHYAPKPTHAPLSLLTVPQANTVELCGVCRTTTDAEQHCDQFIQYLQEFYSQFNLHYRLVQMPARELERMETARTEIQIWLPSEKAFVKVGQVAMWSDFASRRLEIKNNESYLQTVHCTLVRIPTLLAALIEHSQTAVAVL